MPPHCLPPSLALLPSGNPAHALECAPVGVEEGLTGSTCLCPEASGGAWALPAMLTLSQEPTFPLGLPVSLAVSLAVSSWVRDSLGRQKQSQGLSLCELYS